jgi:hypothetical protein
MIFVLARRLILLVALEEVPMRAELAIRLRREWIEIAINPDIILLDYLTIIMYF